MPDTPLLLRSFPHAIVHIDGDAFFASCEQALNPALQHKPVVTGKERGIVSSASYEAKALGVERGSPLYQVRHRWPQVLIVPSDYESYGLFSVRFFEIVRRYTPDVEEYSIDECFADITGLRRPLHMSYPQIVTALQETLEQELGFTFSVGLAPNKTVAKIASKWKKPSGLTMIPGREIHRYLAQLPVGKIWGIGTQTTAYLNKQGVQTALQFAQKPESWASQRLSKPYYTTWQELNGEYILPLDIEGRTTYQSVSKIKTFTPPSNNPAFVLSQLSKNIENACIKARRYNLVTKRIFFYLRTQDFSTHGMQLDLSRPSAFPNEIVALVQPVFGEVFRVQCRYRATGIILMELSVYHERQLDLFEDPLRVECAERLFATVDQIAKKYGKHAIHLGTSLLTHQCAQHLSDRGDAPLRAKRRLKGETARRHLGIPLLGGHVQ